MTPEPDAGLITKAIKQVIDEEVERISREELTKAQQNIEKRVRESVAGISARVFSRFSIERAFGHDLKISVTFNQGENHE
jgi:hypothetical protein